MAGLQLDDAPWNVTQSDIPAANNSPEKWRMFSRDPGVHDNAIRQAHLQQLAEQEVQARPLVDLGTPTKASHGRPGNKPDAIQEKFIPIENRDGHRKLGLAQSPDRLGSDIQGHGRARQQAHRHKVHNTRQSDEAQQPSLQQRSQPIVKNAYPRQPQTQPQATDAASQDRFFPMPRRTHAVAESTVGESDFGFEAEVLGIRRGGKSHVDAHDLRGHVRSHLPVTDDVESLISFGGGQAQDATDNADDQEPECLIDI